MESTRRQLTKVKRELSITELPIVQQPIATTPRPVIKRKLSHSRSVNQSEDMPLVSDNSSLRIMIQQNSESSKTASFHGKDLPTKHNPPPVQECRICFSASCQPTAADPTQTRMLVNPCNCKGSMSFVHESCLIQWLNAKNIRKCELCHSEFDIREQYGSFMEIVKSSFKYLFSNYKRMLKFAIYSVYMFLFFKRFLYVVRYFKDLGLTFLKGYFSLIKKILKFLLMAPNTGLQSLISSFDGGVFKSMTEISSKFKSFFDRKESKTPPRKMKTLLLQLFGKLFRLIALLYNAFILVQLSCIGYAESFRIKRVFNQFLNQTKHIRVIDRHNEQPNQPSPHNDQELMSNNDSQQDAEVQPEEEMKSNTIVLPTLSNIQNTDFSS